MADSRKGHKVPGTGAARTSSMCACVKSVLHQSHDIHMHIGWCVMTMASSEVVELLCACVSGAVAGAVIAVPTMQKVHTLSHTPSSISRCAYDYSLMPPPTETNLHGFFRLVFTYLDGA